MPFSHNSCISNALTALHIHPSCELPFFVIMPRENIPFFAALCHPQFRNPPMSNPPFNRAVIQPSGQLQPAPSAPNHPSRHPACSITGPLSTCQTPHIKLRSDHPASSARQTPHIKPPTCQTPHIEPPAHQTPAHQTPAQSNCSGP